MEYVVLAVIFYFILRTMGNLVRLLGGDEGSSSEAAPERDSSSRRPNGWEGPSPRQQTGTAREEPTFWGEDVEDATWHDVDDGSASEPNAAR